MLGERGDVADDRCGKLVKRLPGKEGDVPARLSSVQGGAAEISTRSWNHWPRRQFDRKHERLPRPHYQPLLRREVARCFRSQDVLPGLNGKEAECAVFVGYSAQWNLALGSA